MIWRQPEALMSGDDIKRTLKISAIIVGFVIAIWLGLFSAAHAGQRSSGTVYLPHPAGCPKVAFCGCGAAKDLFGIPRRDLWPSVAWLQKFPRTQPAPNMVAARRGHVMVLKQHVQGNIWLVADYNSGGHKSRLHQRSIAGFAIVNPHIRMAGL